MGDIVHAMIVLQFIKEFDNEISIDWIVEESFRDLLNSHPQINKVYAINLKEAKKKKSVLILIRELKKLRNAVSYDLVIDLQGLIKSALIARIIPSKVTLGFDRFSIREKAASIFYNSTFKCPYENNVIERNISLVEFAMGITIHKNKIRNKLPFLFANSNKFSFEDLKSKKNIILVPGASNDSKRYPPIKFAKLTELIDANFLIIWGSTKEKLIAEEINKTSKNTTVCKKTSISDLISIISKSDLVIGPDTGPTHIAWALNIPSITIFGSTPGYRNTLQTKINRIIESKSEVNPHKIDINDFSIKEIDVNEIVILSRKLLNE